MRFIPEDAPGRGVNSLECSKCAVGISRVVLYDRAPQFVVTRKILI